METVKMTRIHCNGYDYELQHLFNNYNIYELKRLELQKSECDIGLL